MNERIWLPSRRGLLRAGAAAALGGGAALLAACGSSKAAAPGGSSTTSSAATSSTAGLGDNGTTITIRQAPGAVTLSGALDASWQGIPAVNLDPNDPGVATNGVSSQTPSFTSQIYFQWDPTSLYALEVRTQSPPFENTGADAQYYLGDCFMMFFNTAQTTGTSYVEGDYAFFITPFNGTDVSPRAWDREGHTGGANEHDITSDVKMGYKTTAAGYNFVMALPWKEIQVTAPWTPKKGATLQFSIGGASQTSGGTWGQLQYNGQDDNSGSWGTLALA